jgi:type IV secretory pathway VirB2 component (pilin)
MGVGLGSFARLAAVVFAAALGPAAALAQAEPEPAGTRNFGWVWLVAAVLVVAALFRMIFGRSDRGSASRRP